MLSRYVQSFPWLRLSYRDYTQAKMTNTWDVPKGVIAAGKVELGGGVKRGKRTGCCLPVISVYQALCSEFGTGSWEEILGAECA